MAYGRWRGTSVSFLPHSRFEMSALFLLEWMVLGGEGGIRTPGTLASTSDFETGLPCIVINHLAGGWSLFELVGVVFVSW